jgi:hypothetical protein
MAPQLAKSGDVRQLVDQTRGDEQSSSPNLSTIAQRHDEQLASADGGHDVGVDDMTAVATYFGSTAFHELGRCDAVVAEQPVHSFGWSIARSAGVEHHD